jgi:hypothetical protein
VRSRNRNLPDASSSTVPVPAGRRSFSLMVIVSLSSG